MTSRCNAFSAALVLCLIAALAPCSTEAARILGFFPSPSKSHVIVHNAVMRTLADAGHNVTVISIWPNTDESAPYRHIHIDTPSIVNAALAKAVINSPRRFAVAYYSFLNETLQFSNVTLAHPTMQQFLHDHGAGSFDLLVLGYYMNNLHIGLAAHFRCPVVLSVTIQPTFASNALIGNPMERAYVPTVFSGLLQPMNFWDRLRNFLLFSLEKTIFGFWMTYMEQQCYDYHFPSDRFPSFEEVKKSVSLVLTNHHFASQGPIRPNVPGLIEIGGIQIKDKPDPLPSDIAKVLNESTNGVIYFSLGSIVEGSSLSERKAKIIFAVLSKLPYKVLWKWDDSEVPGTADNIVYKSWLPQDDILAHPNVRLFITHCGQGSVVESQYHGVPMVGIPLFGDQPANMASVEHRGFGVKLDYLKLTENSLKAAIYQVLGDPKYAQAVKTFSTLYRDRPLTPRQMTVYWVEYVLRHKGAKHLQSPAIFLNTWQLMSLDVIGFLLFAIVLGIKALAAGVVIIKNIMSERDDED